ncbi:restriction endonuclease subunit S [Mycolicibacterium gilvum]|uniref:restriction endonuclease subunit S n=1 Tax=Mycolicibacterium gilvum TaxID=1804 RepID=UPI004046043F
MSQTRPLASITTWSSGGTPSRSRDAYWNGTIPWISAATLRGSRIGGSDQHLTEAGLRAGSNLAPRGATLVLVRGMALHRETRIGLAQLPVSFNQDVKALVPKAGILPEFLLYALQARSGQIRELVSSAGSGTGVINTQLLQRLPIWVPSEETQRTVVEAMSDTDDLIATLERLIVKKQAIKLGMMQQLLTGRTRLPRFTTLWAECTLGGIARIKTGSRNNQDKVAGGPYPFFVRSATVERIGSYSYDCEAVLVPGEGGIGSIFHYINGKFEVHQRVYKISDFAPDVSGRFVYYFMRQHFGAHAMENSVKATVDSLRLPTFKNFQFRLPSRDEQDAIVRVLDDAESEVIALEDRLTKARAVKSGMMQQLLTGRTRLPVEAAS